ncbi:hypothetical protein CK203_042982 [Vitis vinifera]|uniref:Disease resistance protein At4g27190-like leucine-rich repeats domain-containing protein n=1 Tax=Vitis vinifera TaxID=29760 RepID=A0A438H060_VITVI|nr:hypothetical protein CK203_042982 [Vitis vinifera]
MEHLQGLDVHHCDDVKISMEREMTQKDVTGLSNYNVAREQYFYNLRYIGIQNCSKLLDLTWVVYASCLEELYVEDCESIELVLHHDHGAYEIVEKLDIFSRLKCLKLNGLPKLKIKGETSWWNQLKWKDETIKDCFTPYFQVHEAEAYFVEESETGGINDDVQEQLVRPDGTVKEVSCLKMDDIPCWTNFTYKGNFSSIVKLPLSGLGLVLAVWQQPGHFSSIVNLLRPVQCGGSEAAAGSMRM